MARLMFKDEKAKTAGIIGLMLLVYLSIAIFICGIVWIRYGGDKTDLQSNLGPVITVSIKLEWNETLLGKSKPGVETVNTQSNTTLYDILVKASLQNPAYVFEATYHARWGYYITSISNIKENTTTKYYWMIYDGDKQVATGVSFYKPNNTAQITFKYQHTVW